MTKNSVRKKRWRAGMDLDDLLKVLVGEKYAKIEPIRCAYPGVGSLSIDSVAAQTKGS